MRDLKKTREAMRRQSRQRARAKKNPNIDEQPRLSPYTTTTVTLLLGEPQQSYTVPQELIECEYELASRMTPIYSSTAQCIILEDIHEDTDHTLVHYLCTGEYEVHCKRSDGAEQYRRSVLAYVAARNLSLGELESLAVAHMERYEDDVDIFQILTVALEVWPMVSADDDDDVYVDNLVDKVTAALEGDLDLYDRDEFVHFGQSLESDNILLRCELRVYARRLSECTCEDAVKLEDEVKGEETDTTEYETTEDEDSAFEEHDEKKQCRE